MGSRVNQTAPNWLKSCCKWASTKVTQPTNVVVKTSVISSWACAPRNGPCRGSAGQGDSDIHAVRDGHPIDLIRRRSSAYTPASAEKLEQALILMTASPRNGAQLVCSLHRHPTQHPARWDNAFVVRFTAVHGWI